MTRILLFGGHFIDVPMPMNELNDNLVVAYQEKKNVLLHGATYFDHTGVDVVVSPEKIAGLVAIHQ